MPLMLQKITVTILLMRVKIYFFFKILEGVFIVPALVKARKGSPEEFKVKEAQAMLKVHISPFYITNFKSAADYVL